MSPGLRAWTRAVPVGLSRYKDRADATAGLWLTTSFASAYARSTADEAGYSEAFARRLADAAGGKPLTVGFTVTGALGRV